MGQQNHVSRYLCAVAWGASSSRNLVHLKHQPTTPTLNCRRNKHQIVDGAEGEHSQSSQKHTCSNFCDTTAATGHVGASKPATFERFQDAAIYAATSPACNDKDFRAQCCSSGSNCACDYDAGRHWHTCCTKTSSKCVHSQAAIVVMAAASIGGRRKVTHPLVVPHA